VSKSIDAGIYPIKDAVNHCIGMSLSDCFEIEIIDIYKHNEIVNLEIEKLKSKLINTK